MSKEKGNNVFISHYSKDDDKVQRLKKRFGDIINGKEVPIENPAGGQRAPLYQMATINC